MAKPIILRRSALDAIDAQRIASTAQQYAAEIMNCLVSQSPDLHCLSVDSTEVTEIRDDPQNHGIEFAELNASVKQLESSLSDDGLKHAALVLRAVAEKLIAMSQALQSHDQPTEEHYSEMAGRTATRIRVCLVDQQKEYKYRIGAAAFCNSQYALSVSEVANGLRDRGLTTVHCRTPSSGWRRAQISTSCNTSPI